MKAYYVYILRCSDGSFYVGITNDINRRLVEHNKGKDRSTYTYSRRPVKVVFTQEFNDVEQAIRFEKKIKKWSKSKKEALVLGDFELLQSLSECRNATHHKYKPD
jgi:putative endonuclease